MGLSKPSASTAGGDDVPGLSFFKKMLDGKREEKEAGYSYKVSEAGAVSFKLSSLGSTTVRAQIRSFGSDSPENTAGAMGALAGLPSDPAPAQRDQVADAESANEDEED